MATDPIMSRTKLGDLSEYIEFSLWVLVQGSLKRDNGAVAWRKNDEIELKSDEIGQWIPINFGTIVAEFDLLVE